ncbi:MAG: antitoxin Xre/MbcA/ParS toxin-binding domain-containing protein [Gammaproteobacteria bacterium]
MSTARHQPAADPAERGRVLTKAVRAAAAALGLTQRDLAQVLGASEASVSRFSRSRDIPYPSKEAELGALLVRLYRSLDTLVGGDPAKAQAWFNAENLHLRARPAERVRSVEGLVDVVRYLDAMRGTL